MGHAKRRYAYHHPHPVFAANYHSIIHITNAIVFILNFRPWKLHFGKFFRFLFVWFLSAMAGQYLPVLYDAFVCFYSVYEWKIMAEVEMYDHQEAALLHIQNYSTILYRTQL